jgi:hypothetical protein
MIYGNTGAGLVDVDVPQSPLYQQALPNLRDVSAAAWGLPSLDDISVPDVTTEKDIQTDTDLTQKYFDLATKLKNYAVKGRSVGIDVTKPKNNPTHLQFSQEWNKMYQEFLQTGKELKRGKENIAQLNKFQSNPNSIVGSVPQGQVMTDETLSKYSMESPFADIKPVIKGYQSLRIYDQPSYDKFMAKWKADIAQVDNEAKIYKAQKPELAAQIDAKAEEAKMAMFPPNVDPRFYAKLEQDMTMHKNLMANKWANTGIAREGLEFRKSQPKETTPTYAFEELGRTILGDGSNTVFNGQPYYDTNLGTTNSKGEIIYPTINKIEKRIYNPDGSIDALVSLNIPSLDDAGNVVFERKDIKVNAFDKEGNPTYQNSNLYNSIQEYATKKGKSYSNISGQEVGSGKPNVTPTTAKNNPGFKGQNNTPNPKTINKSDIPAKAKAAGYSVEEYTKLLKEKGVTIK